MEIFFMILAFIGAFTCGFLSSLLICCIYILRSYRKAEKKRNERMKRNGEHHGTVH